MNDTDPDEPRRINDIMPGAVAKLQRLLTGKPDVVDAEAETEKEGEEWPNIRKVL